MNVSEIKGVITKEELLTKVSDYEALEPHHFELGNAVNFRTNTDDNIFMSHPGGESLLESPAVATLASTIGLSRAYLKKIPKERQNALIVPHLNYWYRTALAGHFLRLLNVGNRTIMAVPDANFDHIRISSVISAAERQLGKEQIAGYHKVWIQPDLFQFSILTPREVEIKEGDSFNAGIRIEFSLTGKSSTKLSAYLFRQWCANGATTEEQLETFSRRDSSASNLDTWLQESIQRSSGAFDREVEKIRALLQIPVNGYTANVLDSVLAQSSIPLSLQKEVRSVLLNKHPETLYDVYNALTEIDTHSEYFDEHQNSRGSLNRIATHLTHHSELCPQCHKQL